GYVVFTKGYSTYNTNNPSKYFIVDEWNKVTLSNNEACIEMGQASQFEDAGAFISKENQIALSDKVSGKNWMSAISGERKLNEINIPGVHDAAMNSVRGYADENVGTGVLNWTNNAKTQNEYIDELLNDGVRLFDLRIINQYRKNVRNEIKEDKFGPTGDIFSYIPADDRKNLWLVHGKTYIGGTFYAQNHDGEDLSLKEVLSWFKTFLTLHPTETIIAEFKAETSYDDQITKIYSRLYDHLEELSKEINPSTNKSFIYMEDGDFSKTLTDYPYLKDTRGQIIIKCTANNEAVSDLGGLKTDTFGGKYKSYSQSVGYNTYAEGKIESLKEFFEKYGNQRLLTDATEHFDIIYTIGTNCAPSSGWGQITTTPLKEAKKVIEALFQKNGYFDRPGFYLGWVKTDGLNPEQFSYIWKSNFSDDLEYYDITVNSGLGTDQFETQTYRLLKGTKITIPGCIYDYDQEANKNYFTKWKMNNTYCYEGQSIVVDGSMTFTAMWSSDPTYEENIKNVVDKITEIGSVEYSEECFNKINSARNLYDALTDEQKEAITNYDSLTQAEKEYYELANEAIANETIDLINQIGEVKYPDSYTQIIKARFSYIALTDAQKQLVTNYDSLTQAEETYISLNDSYKANETIDLINQIGEVAFTEECTEKIEAAYNSYEDLTATQKPLVTNYDILLQANVDYYNLMNQTKAGETIDLINQIGEVKYPDSYESITNAKNSYISLSDVQKALVTNYETLVQAEDLYNNLLNDYNLSQNVIDLINKIGDVEDLSSLSPIASAITAYDFLTDSQKQLVANYDVLESKQELFNQLQIEETELVESTIYYIDSIKTVTYPSSLSSIN
ncbi:MAG: hypothetical protein K6G38_01290, partial [Gammaproteobacteria bacterium]|nr:hypothetical protein [Gammaproteobacteria bacterium]